MVIRGDQSVIDAGDIQEGLDLMVSQTCATLRLHLRRTPTCHFKQLGLKDGLPAAASTSLLNT